jgi:hypothetical protein
MNFKKIAEKKSAVVQRQKGVSCYPEAEGDAVSPFESPPDIIGVDEGVAVRPLKYSFE